MSVSANRGRNTLFKAAWILLLAPAALMTLNHFVLVFALDDPILFIGWTAFTLYALLVIATPFRRLEKWAWYATWLLPAGLAAGGFSAPDVALVYYTAAAVGMLGLLLAMRDFFAIERRDLRSLS